MSMTSTAKGQLSKTIRDLRTLLLETLHDETDRVYRMSVSIKDASLDARTRVRRERLEAWMAEQVRAQATTKGARPRSAEAFRLEAEKQAAYTLLNRLVMLRLMEASGLRAPKLVTGGWESRAYKDFRQVAQALVRGDETEGYAFLLGLVFEDLSTDLPGLFGPAGVADLIPVPAATLRQVVTALDNAELESCWTDDMTLGWIYQYWNDPEREKLDEKINGGGKIEPHEIASKTQMFTERYMVDWLLQNSLNPMWLAMCKRHGWTPEVEANGILLGLETRRTEWRAKQKIGEVSMVELMPLDSEVERRWAYYVPHPIPHDAITHAPETVRNIKLLDPAVGSGHFLVVAFDMLAALYREEARHRGEVGLQQWSDRAIVERILEHNLNGIDIDPRAVQIAAAALWLKAQQACTGAAPRQLNLVAPSLSLATLPDNDPALVELRREVERETGIPADLTNTIVHSLRGADYLGSLLRINAAVSQALTRHEQEIASRRKSYQPTLFGESGQSLPFEVETARISLLSKLEVFLAQHSAGDDLGLRLRGEQLAAGVRFVRMTQEKSYDLVVANPPYQGTAKIRDAAYVQEHYPLGKADLYAAFIERGLQLLRIGGCFAQVSMNGWMFVKQYAQLRKELLTKYRLLAVADLLWCAFESMRHNTVAMYVVQKLDPSEASAVGLVPTNRNEREESLVALERKRAAVLCQVGKHAFAPIALKVVPEWPLVFWWNEETLDTYRVSPTVAQVYPPRVGLQTGDNARFVRYSWELSPSSVSMGRPSKQKSWAPLIKGADGMAWCEPFRFAINWKYNGLGVYLHSGAVIRNPDCYFKLGVSYTTIGNGFSARAHRVPSVIMDMGSSVFPVRQSDALALFNSSYARFILESLNPTIHFTSGDVARLPARAPSGSPEILQTIENAFSLHESHREPSVEFKQPGPSPWRNAQEWAQAAVDRPEETQLLPYESENDSEPATDHMSFALGVALGRFKGAGEGILDSLNDDLSDALPAGILFLDGTQDSDYGLDSLGHPAAVPLHTAWAAHSKFIGTKRKSLREWLTLDFFKDIHKVMYENRPIHWPLSSENKTFVAWVNIHRWNVNTLHILLADHLHPTLVRLEGELMDLREIRDGADKQAAGGVEKRYEKVSRAKDELVAYINRVEQCADQGPPPTDPKCLPREKDIRYNPNVEDGVMINSSALWPLLEPQWKDPKKWWKELSSPQGKKDYDWSHLAMRYWPGRVDAKCQADPSLSVAHGCFWRYHPTRAWAWELRLQHEIDPEFRIQEAPYRDDGGDATHRAAYLRDNPAEAVMAIEKEALRRRGRGKTTQPVTFMRILESGLWSSHPDLCWQAELSVSQKQGVEFRLLAPDEAEARAAYEQAHPKKVFARGQILQSLVPPPVLFEKDEPDTDADEDTEEAYEEVEA